MEVTGDTKPEVADEELATSIDGIWFKDKFGRSKLFHGVNLSGASKVPSGPVLGYSHVPDHFFDHHDVTFVNRPFPLTEADDHFGRLREWGFRFLRFIVTWEALEHAGPYVTSLHARPLNRPVEESMMRSTFDYLLNVLEKAKLYGFQCFLDPHMDVVSYKLLVYVYIETVESFHRRVRGTGVDFGAIL